MSVRHSSCRQSKVASRKMSKVTKTLISCGKRRCDFNAGSKGLFHFQTYEDEGDDKNSCRLIDDSKLFNNGLPVEIIFGKQFKLQVLENVIRNMLVDEIAEFSIDKSVKFKRKLESLKKSY